MRRLQLPPVDPQLPGDLRRMADRVEVYECYTESAYSYAEGLRWLARYLEGWLPEPGAIRRVRRFREWLADVPVLSLVLLKLRYVDSGRCLVEPVWRWRSCGEWGPVEKPVKLGREPDPWSFEAEGSAEGAQRLGRD